MCILLCFIWLYHGCPPSSRRSWSPSGSFLNLTLANHSCACFSGKLRSSTRCSLRPSSVVTSNSTRQVRVIGNVNIGMLFCDKRIRVMRKASLKKCCKWPKLHWKMTTKMTKSNLGDFFHQWLTLDHERSVFSFRQKESNLSKWQLWEKSFSQENSRSKFTLRSLHGRPRRT